MISTVKIIILIVKHLCIYSVMQTLLLHLLNLPILITIDAFKPCNIKFGITFITFIALQAPALISVL